MFPIGICTGFDNVPEAFEIGFDFIEVPLRDLEALPESDFLELKDYVEGVGIPIRGCYHMLPDGMRITGEGVSAQAQHEYIKRAFSRASAIGVHTIAMDCPKARHVPDEHDFPMAWRQLGNFLRLVQGHAKEHDMTIAVEPVRKGECNLLNLVSEATLMAALLQLGNVGVLANTGSMAMASEPLSALRRAAPLLKHVHLDSALKKGLPALGDGENYEKIFAMLHSIGYAGGVSVRAAHTTDFAAEARAALDCLRLTAGRIK